MTSHYCFNHNFDWWKTILKEELGLLRGFGWKFIDKEVLSAVRIRRK